VKEYKRKRKRKNKAKPVEKQKIKTKELSNYPSESKDILVKLPLMIRVASQLHPYSESEKKQFSLRNVSILL